MADNWQPSKEETALIYSFALQNILEYGEAQMGSIMGKLSQNFDMKQYGKLLPRYVIAQVNKANALLQKEGVEAVREELIEIDSSKMERLQREKVKIERVFPDLPNVEQGNFKVRFAPNPNAPLTVGHMRGVLINKYYADKYNGEFVLRFDDTSTDVKPPIIKAYIQILKDIKWLTGKAPDDVLIASDRMDIYYDYANQLISMNGAYMCNCKNFKELKDASIPCPHRDLSVEENLELFNKMKQGDFEAGEWVLRARTDLDAPNPAHRDFVLFRVQRNAHPRTGDSYKAWPMLDFQSAIDDHLSGVTHIIRGIDLQDSTAKQKILYSVFDWDYPETTYWGRVKILDQNDNEVKFSSSQYAKDIAEGKFTGWDDKRLYTVQAFKNRGYTPEALLNWWLEYGLTRKPITVSMKTLDTLQKREGKGEVMEAEDAEEFNAINVSNTTLSTYKGNRHRKFDHKQARRHNFGMAFCKECGELFMKDNPNRRYCYGDCAIIVRRRNDKKYMRKKLANMTGDELKEYKRRRHESYRKIKANRTDEERQERNRKQREYRRKRKANMTEEELRKRREYYRKIKANPTDEERQEINRKRREYQRKRRANMTDEEREEHNRKERERARKYYAKKKKEMEAEERNPKIPSHYYKTYGKKGAEVRFRIKERILKERSMGTKAGQWSARKSQKLKEEYEKEMRKKGLKPYVSSKRTGKQKDLKKWGDQSWRTKSGRKSSVTGEPYFPKKAIEALKKKKLYAKAKRQKVAATKKGKQYASYSPDIKKVVAQYRAEDAYSISKAIVNTDMGDKTLWDMYLDEDLYEYDCMHFANELSEYLTGEGIENEIQQLNEKPNFAHAWVYVPHEKLYYDAWTIYGVDDWKKLGYWDYEDKMNPTLPHRYAKKK